MAVAGKSQIVLDFSRTFTNFVAFLSRARGVGFRQVKLHQISDSDPRVWHIHGYDQVDTADRSHRSFA